MSDNTEIVAELTNEIVEAVTPILNGVETGIAVSALLNVAITTVMLGLGCDQARAMKLIAATLRRKRRRPDPPSTDAFRM